MIEVARPTNTVDLREEVLRLEEELKIRQWHEQQLAIADGKLLQRSPAGLIVEIRTLNYSNGDKFEGEVLDALRHGSGKHTCSNGDTYDGAWQYDKRHGRGTANFARGLRYEGQWKEDMAHGTGTATYENGAVYEGDFRKDHRWGWGLQRFPDGSSYEGEWYDDLIEGKGRFSYPDGSYFEGELGNGRRVHGQFISGDGSIEYDGCWKQDRYHGKGVMVVRDSWKYTGEWLDGLQHGTGICEHAGGLRYEGDWRGGVRCGRGTLTAQGYWYEGEWADDKQHGHGKCLLETGDKFDGQWREGQRHGSGSCLYASKDKYHGAWEHGVRCGEGTCEYANGDSYQGGWRQDKRHGFGRCKFADGTRFAGRWEDDGWVQSAADAARSGILPECLPLSATAGCDCCFSIQARDDLGNKRLTGGDEFVAELRGPSTVYATIADGGNGTYRATLNTTTAGDHLLHITIGGEPVADSPYLVAVSADAGMPRKCTATGLGCTAATCSRVSQFVIEVRDRHSNRCCSAKALALLQLEVELTCGDFRCDVEMMSSAATGQIVCTYTAPAPGMYRLQLTAANPDRGGARVHIASSPHSVQVRDLHTAAEEQSPCATGSAEGVGPSDDGPQASLPPLEQQQQQQPVIDQSQLWADIAAASFGADGVMDGWDSDTEQPQTSESRYLQAHPNVPVVENLEDLWLVSKLQRERKAKEQAAKQQRLAQLQGALQDKFGDPVPAPPPSSVLPNGDGNDSERRDAEFVSTESEHVPQYVPIPTRLPACTK